MKTKSKALLLTLCAVLLVTASVLGTMAFLTSNDEVVNTFSVGSVAIKLDEAKANTDGSLVEGACQGQQLQAAAGSHLQQRPHGHCAERQ